MAQKPQQMCGGTSARHGRDLLLMTSLKAAHHGEQRLAAAVWAQTESGLSTQIFLTGSRKASDSDAKFLSKKLRTSSGFWTTSTRMTRTGPALKILHSGSECEGKWVEMWDGLDKSEIMLTCLGNLERRITPVRVGN